MERRRWAKDVVDDAWELLSAARVKVTKEAHAKGIRISHEDAEGSAMILAQVAAMRAIGYDFLAASSEDDEGDEWKRGGDDDEGYEVDEEAPAARPFSLTTPKPPRLDDSDPTAP